MNVVVPIAIGFVTPAFALAGGLLVALPIAIHFLNRRRFKVVEWAAMNFLLQAMRRNRRRLRFESWLLLAARCGVMALMGLALSRPVGCDKSSIAGLAGQRSGLHVIVIDNSYSMAFEADRPDAKTNLDQAKLIAVRLISRLNNGGDSTAIVTAANPAAAVILSPTYDLDAARRAVEHIEQTFAGTALPDALQIALKIGQEDSKQANRFLDIITDGTRPAWEAAGEAQSLESSGRDLAKLFHLAHYNVGRPNEFNAAVTELKPAATLLRRGYANDLLAHVVSFGTGSSPTAKLIWKLDDELLAGAAAVGDGVPLSADSPPITQSRIQFTRGGPHVLSLALAGVDDRLKLDDIRQLVVNVASDLNVLIVEGEHGVNGTMGGSGSFLMQALAPRNDDRATAAEKRVGYVAPELISDLELGNKVLSDYRAVIFAGVSQVSAPQADALQKFVSAGGTLMLFMGEPVSGENYNAMLLPRHLLPGALVKRINAPSGGDPFYFDFQPQGLLHPLLQKFRGNDKSGLDKTSVYTYWQVDLPRDSQAQRVLNFARSTNGASATQPTTSSSDLADPAITVQSLGQGQVLFVATSAYIEWSTLPAKLNFAPLVHELLSGTVNSGDAWMNLNVGDALHVPPGMAMAAVPVLKDAQQNQIVLEQTTTPDGSTAYRSPALVKPGVYMLTIAGGEKSNGEAQRLPVAVNVPAEEADVRPVEAAGIRKALGDVAIDLHADDIPATEASARELEGRDFGWSFMAALLALAALECAMAMRFGHTRR